METGFRFRLYLLTALILLGCGTLLSRLKSFQIDRQQEFIAKIPGTRTVNIREPGVRGHITDRNGLVMVENTRNYEVAFNLQEIAKAYNEHHLKERTMETLTYEKGMPRKKNEKDIVAIVEETIVPILENHKLVIPFSKKALRAHYLTYQGLVPFTYRNDLTYEQFSRFAEHSLELPGVYIEVRPSRKYPYGSLASHILGYTKQWDKGDIPEKAKKEFDLYLGEQQGIAGIEATMNEYLIGPEGKRSLIKDEKGHIIGVADYLKAGTGANVKLTIDAGLQTLTENVLRKAGRAAAVVMNVETGEVLALASIPDYTPSFFIPSIAKEKYAEYINNPASPFTNRAITGTDPGSTFKLATALTGCMNGHHNDRISCDGFVPYGNHHIGCWIYNKSRGSHGGLDLTQAIQKSCNPYFNKLANALGTRKMSEGFETLGLGLKSGIPLPNEDPGIVPGSDDWKTRIRPNQSMTPALGAMMSMGQGDSSASPLQMATLVAAIANNGQLHYPRIVKEVVNPEGKVLVEDKPNIRVNLQKSGIPAKDFETIRKGMWMAVNQPGGTAGSVNMKDPNFEVCAKTGTAQTVSRGQKSHNAWTVSFGPFNKPKYAIAVVVQGGESGGGTAGPLVNLIWKGILTQEKGGKLPITPMTEVPGHFDEVLNIVLPTDDPLLKSLAADESSATDASTLPQTAPILVRPNIILPTPTITPEVEPKNQDDPDQ